MRSTQRSRILVAGTTAFALITLTGVQASASGDSTIPLPETPGTPAASSIMDPEALRSKLSLPPIPQELADLSDALQERYKTDDRFGSVSIDDDRTFLEVSWHGEVPEAIVSEENVEVVQSAYRPGDLRRAAQELAGTEVDGATIIGAGVEPDGSGLYVDLDADSAQADASARRAGQSVADTLTERAGVPVSVSTETTVEPAVGRLADNLHLGGARVTRFSNGSLFGSCSTGFSARRYIDSADGILFAAHCGQIGSQWVRTEIFQGGVSAYTYGDLVDRTRVRDSAVMTTGWSYPYIYIDDYQSTSYIGVQSVAPTYTVGQELCSSGSYSGVTCGGKVVALDYYVDYPNSDIDNARTARIVNELGQPLWGNGDSGGPIFDLVVADNVLRPRAVGIISGIQTNSAVNSSLCYGVPGTPPDVQGRKCSYLGLGAYAKDSADILGWRILTLSQP